MNDFVRFDPTTLGVILVAGVIAHLILMVLGKRYDTLAFLLGAFFVLAPLSASILVPGFEYIKYLRVYVSLLIVVVAVMFYRSWNMGPAALTFTVWTLIYWGAVVWGPDPVGGALVKGFFLVVVLAGIFMATNIRSFEQLSLTFRIVALFSAFWIFFVPAGVASGRGSFFFGRLMAWGLNSNRLGHELAAMLIVAMTVALYDKSKSWRLFGYLTGGGYAMIIAMTGSRASLGMAVLAGVCLTLPLVRRPSVFIGSWSAAAVIGAIVLKFTSSEASERLGELDFGTRFTEWQYGLGLWRASPIFGVGWALDPESPRAASSNLHSIYLQVLAETGVLGLAFLFIILFSLAVRAYRLHKQAFGDPNAGFAYFAIGGTIACFAHGVAESGTIQGSNNNSILLAFCIGLIDRVSVLMEEARVQREADAYYAYEQQLQQGSYEGYPDAAYAYAPDPSLPAPNLRT